MKKIYFLLFLSMTLCMACEWKLKQADSEDMAPLIEVVRYDQLEFRYLTTGDFSALQEMNTEYPMETRTLVEDVLELGQATSPEINTTLLKFFQDTNLQTLLADVETQYADMDDVNRELNAAFTRLKRWFPDLQVPQVYAQVSALNHSIIVGDQMVGISLDKYLGADYPLYLKYDYSKQQRQQMERGMIVPDLLCFYLMSHYGLADFELRSQQERDLHVGKIQWVVNKAVERQVFRSSFVEAVDKYVRSHASLSYEELLKLTDYSQF